MCELCKIVESAKQGPTEEGPIRYADGLSVIADSLGDKKKKDGFQPKVCIYRQHQIEPLPPIKEAIIENAKRLFRDRKLWFPSTDDFTEHGKRLPLSELSAHWYFIIE
jgi:hypothetical protein